MKFFLRKDFWLSSLANTPNDYIEVVDVDVVSIKQLVAEHNPSVLICDIEGGEINLIDSDWTRGIRLVIMEVHENQFDTQGLRKLKDFFTQLSFDVSLDSGLLLATRSLHAEN